MSPTDLLRIVRGSCKCAEPTGQQQDAANTPGATAASQVKEPEVVARNSPDGISREIDVSQLPPPLPMVRILETLRELGPGETLLVRHTRRPLHLYPKLEALGCSHETVEPEPGKVEVRITNPPTRPS
ncbi:MAG: DUF2249 domain-containing protein [Chloroflexota bacterium]